jgi:hypothetical protein
VQVFLCLAEYSREHKAPWGQFGYWFGEDQPAAAVIRKINVTHLGPQDPVPKVS